MDLMEKLEILSDAAKYDAACTSSGVSRAAPRGGIGSCVTAGLCHSFAALYFTAEGPHDKRMYL